MASFAAVVPADTDLLCAACGYVLSGLPADSRCPECGTPISESDRALRVLPEWERRPASVAAFIRTTAAIIFRPTRFFRSLATRADRRRSQWFAAVHLLIAAILFGFIGQWHVRYTELHFLSRQLALPLGITAFIVLAGVNWAAAWLTHWEGTYRGLRLPIMTVRRVMDYHAAHYLPVAAIVAATVWVFVMLNDAGKLSPGQALGYFYVLSGEVIIAAVYLFLQYWTAMRNVMYANA